MRKLLRRGVRGFLWIIKGLLLLLAVAVLLVWAMSRGKYLSAFGREFTVRAERVDMNSADVESRNGWIVASYWAAHFLNGNELGAGRQLAAQQGKGWRWGTFSAYESDLWIASFEGWGPLRWQFATESNTERADESRTIAISCWLLAPLLALWPLTSLTLLIRRRTRRRRRITTGCCQQCGYDLRATADKSGPLLAGCPECGAESALRVSSVEQSALDLNSRSEDKAGGLS